MARHIHAITLVVPDYDTGITFYVGTLGFDLVCNQALENGKRWVLVRPAGAETALLLARATDRSQARAIGNQTGGRVGFFLHSDDFDEDYKKMLDSGVEFEETPRCEPYGKVAVWRDPFGNRWDLLQLWG